MQPKNAPNPVITPDKVVKIIAFTPDIPLVFKGREIEIYLKTKEIEFNKLETPLQKQKFQETVQAELKTKENAFNDFRNRREEQVYQRIYAVSEKIRLEKGLDILIDARGVFSGGVDITDAVIQRLNSNGGMK